MQTVIKSVNAQKTDNCVDCVAEGIKELVPAEYVIQTEEEKDSWRAICRYHASDYDWSLIEQEGDIE